MNVFEFLTEEAHSVVRRFNDVVEHYPATADWTWDRAFEETKKDIAMLTEHLKKETVVENNVSQSQDMAEQMDKAASQRKEINSSIDNVLMIHVDEAGFKEGLQKIAEKLDLHTNFCTKSYYPLLQQHLSANELQNIEDQLEFSLPG
jgi:RNase adaptor protein for sRNA GlmZ degradation